MPCYLCSGCALQEEEDVVAEFKVKFNKHSTLIGPKVKSRKYAADSNLLFELGA